MTKYPTKEEILATPVEYSSQDLEWIKDWKYNHWRKVRNHEDIRARIYALDILVQTLARFRNMKITVHYKPELPTACFVPAENAIYLVNSSIISALHECAHSLYGDSELKACAFSVQLFIRFFPKAYAKLKWHGHQLKVD